MELDYEEILNQVFNPFYKLDEADSISAKRLLKEEYLKPQTSYMLRNDGKLINVTPIHPYIWYNPYTSEKEGIERLINKDIKYIRWFYDNTQYPEIKEAIRVFLSSLLDVDYYNIDKNNIVNNFDTLYELDYIETNFNINEMFKSLNDAMNQEFCRVRTSHMKFNVGNSGDIYFRIGSTDFDWFNLIYKLVSENRHFIETVTICTDSQSLGGRPRFLKLGGKEINVVPVEDFLSFSGKPVFESYKQDSPTYILNQGKSLLEAFDDYYFGHIHNLFESFRNKYIEEHFSSNPSEINTLRNIDLNLDETFLKGSNLDKHYEAHVAKNWEEYIDDEKDELFDPTSKEEYNRLGDNLSKQPVYTSDVDSSDNIVGYVAKNGRIVKYNKATNELIVYVCNKNDQTTIAYYKTDSRDNHHSYRTKKNRDYLREIEPDDDYYNR